MDTLITFCPRRKGPVQFTQLRAPAHLGQANLRDDVPEAVCLEYGAHCSGEFCAVTGERRIVMGVRLARSGLRESPWEVVNLYCPECAAVRELMVIDAEHGYCAVCGSTVGWATADGESLPG